MRAFLNYLKKYFSSIRTKGSGAYDATPPQEGKLVVNVKEPFLSGTLNDILAFVTQFPYMIYKNYNDVLMNDKISHLLFPRGDLQNRN